jgi:NADH:quinone reductase (non-electrogenic)
MKLSVRKFWNSKTEPVRVVIVGAGFGGLSAARQLEKHPHVEVTIVDRTNHHLFQPLLYQVATGGLNPAEIASPVRTLFKNSARTTVVLGSLTGLEFDKRRAVLDNGRETLTYDYLILAMGGRTSYFGHPEWERYAPGLKTLEDANRIREQVLLSFEKAERARDPESRRRHMTVAVVGGGPTGVEMAGALAELRRHVLRREFKNIKPEDARVILIEGGPRLLSGFPEKLSEKASKELAELGVEVLYNERLEDIGDGFLRTSRRTIETENIVWAAGVGGHPLSHLVGSETDRAGRVKIDHDLRVPGQDCVFCVGDMMTLDGAKGKPLPGVAPVAIQQGKLAAKNIIRLTKSKATRSFSYFDKGSMATIGRSSAVAVMPGGLTLSGWTAWLGWLAIHLTFIVDLQNRILVMMRWAWAYLGWRWNVRLITAPLEHEIETVPSDKSRLTNHRPLALAVAKNKF